MVIHKDKNPAEIQDIIASSKAIIIDVFTTWCPPCKELAKVLATISKKHKNITIVKINLDKASDTEESLEEWKHHLPFIKDVIELGYVPIMVFFKDGKLVDQLLDEGEEKKGFLSGYNPVDVIETVARKIEMI